MTTAYRHPEAPAAPRVRYKWTLIELPSNDDLSSLVVFVTLAVIASWLILACCFIAHGSAPYVLRWAAVNVALTALWCITFVRREVVP